MQYGWTIRDKDFASYVLPAKFEYADWEILVLFVIFLVKGFEWSADYFIF